LKRNRRGIARLVEVIMASALLVASLSVSYFYLVAANPITLRGQSDLDRIGYDLLGTLSSQGGFDTSIVNSAGAPVAYFENGLTVTLGSVLPVGILFNLTVYEAVNSTGAPLTVATGLSTAQLLVLNSVSDPAGGLITNAQSSAFLHAGVTAQITYLYTTKIFPNGNFFILVFMLQLAEAEAA